MRIARPIAVLAFALMMVGGCGDKGGKNGDDNNNNNNNVTGGDTIYQLQDESHENYIPEGAEVDVRGVVVTAVDNYGQYTGDIFVQEAAGGPFSGVRVFRPQLPSGTEIGDIVVGTIVNVRGVKAEFALEGQDPTGRTVTQIVNGSVTIVGPGEPLEPETVPSPEYIMNDPGGEEYEGVLVRVENVRAEDVNQWGEIIFSGGLIVGDNLMDIAANVDIGECYSEVVGVVDYFFKYVLHPRTSNDFVVAANDSVCPDSEWEDATIYQLQDESHADYIEEGTKVSLTNVVVTAVDNYGEYTGNIYVQEPEGGKFSGIALFRPWLPAGVDLEDIHIGDIVNVRGTKAEWAPSGDTSGRTVTQLTGSTITIVDQGDPLDPEIVDPPDYLVDDPGGEEYEGVLVEVQNVRAEHVNQWGEIVFTNGIIIADNLMDIAGEIELGACYSRVVGVVDYFYKYLILPRSADDLVLSADDSACLESEWQEVSIYQLQDEDHADFIEEDAKVRLRGVVVTAVDNYGEYTGNIYVQEPDGGKFSGIALFRPWRPAGVELDDINPGDIVDVMGVKAEWAPSGDDSGRTVTQLTSASITIVGQGDPLDPEMVSPPDYIVDDPGGEEYEGVLLGVENVRALEVNQFGEIVFTGGVIVGDNLMDIEANITIGDCYSMVVGVLDYFYKYRVLPRSAADLMVSADDSACPQP